MQSTGDTAPSPGADLECAVDGGLALIGRLLTRGEAQVLADWRALPSDARSLYGRLFVRRDRLLPRAGLCDNYAEVADPEAAVRALSEAGFLWRNPEHPLPVSWRVALYDRTELSMLCKRLKLPRSGRRTDLEERLILAGSHAAFLMDRPGIRLRHRRLFQRLCRVYLGRSDADLSALVLHRMGTVRFAEYEPTGGTGPFPDRRTLVQFETTRRWAHRVLGADAISAADGQLALKLVRDAPSAPREYRRFRSKRYAIRVLSAMAEGLERSGDTTAATDAWEVLAHADHPDRAHALRRYALCSEKSGDTRNALTALEDARDGLPSADRLALERTGRRLARRAGRPWRPSPPLEKPRHRTLDLPIQPTRDTRPLWSGDVVEEAVAKVVREGGRTVVHSENLLWTTLFGVLLRDVLFAPVPEMLPGALQMAPLDLGLPEFAARRAPQLTAALAELRAEGGLARLTHTWTHHYGEAIRGVAWDRWSFERLAEILAGLGGTHVADILSAMAHGASRSGLPDLLILAGPSIRIAGLFPGRLPPHAVFAEVKGPGDTLRDGQRVWLDRLVRMEATAEVWEVRSKPGTTPRLG
jgi:hypothetical protein